jgi:hypothetical protein
MVVRLTDLMGGTSTCWMPLLACSSAFILAAAAAAIFVSAKHLRKSRNCTWSDLRLRLDQQWGDCAILWLTGCDSVWSLPVLLRATSTACQSEMLCVVQAQSDQSGTA